MRLALQEAARGTPHPNPHVGAVVVANGRVVAVGHHERAGLAHAEKLALTLAKEAARGATLYVTLEPCNHFGRTPPCADAVLRSGIVRVVIGCPDPNANVLGGGAARLAAMGLAVDMGICLADAEARIEDWRVLQGTG